MKKKLMGLIVTAFVASMSLQVQAESCFMKVPGGYVSLEDKYMFMCKVDEADWSKEERILAKEFYAYLYGNFVPSKNFLAE